MLAVNDKNVVEYRAVKMGRLYDGLRVIQEGLKPGELVIVNGIQRARPGLTVDPQRVEITDPWLSNRAAGERSRDCRRPASTSAPH
jgi:multidrug efflux system membrane fusion protein